MACKAVYFEPHFNLGYKNILSNEIYALIYTITQRDDKLENRSFVTPKFSAFCYMFIVFLDGYITRKLL